MSRFFCRPPKKKFYMKTEDLTPDTKLQINQLDTCNWLIVSGLYFFYFFWFFNLLKFKTVY